MHAPNNRIISLPYAQLAALEWNAEQATTILALHGWLDNAASFSHLAPLLADYHVLAIDLLGHGESDRLLTETEFNFENAITLVKDVIEHLGKDNVILLGHSIGATIASMVAIHYPQWVKKLIMIDAIGPLTAEVAVTHLPLKISVAAFKAAEQRGEKIYPSKPDMLSLRAKVNQLTETQILPLFTRAIETVDGGFRWCHDPNLKLASMMTLNEPQVQEFFKQLTVPTLVIEASQGLIRNANVLAERKAIIPNLQYITLEGGHHVHLSHPADVAHVIQNFCRKHTT